MKFRYKKYGPGVLRPVIPIEVVKNDVEVSYEVLVDSGADLCIFDAHIAEILRIDLVKGERREVSGLTGFMSMQGSAYGIVGQKEDLELKAR